MNWTQKLNYYNIIIKDLDLNLNEDLLEFASRVWKQAQEERDNYWKKEIRMIVDTYELKLKQLKEKQK